MDRCGRAPREIKASANSRRYYVLTLYRDCQKHSLNLHALVCRAFHGDPPEGMQAAHGNGDKSDNSADNLRWATPKENCDDRGRHGNHVAGEKQHLARLTDEMVTAMRQMAATGMKHRQIAARFGVARPTASHAIRGYTWKHV